MVLKQVFTSLPMLIKKRLSWEPFALLALQEGELSLLK